MASVLELERRLHDAERRANQAERRAAVNEARMRELRRRPRAVAPTRGQQLLRRAFAAKVEELALTHARTTAQMLNVQKGCFEAELEALAAEASDTCAALERTVVALRRDGAVQAAALRAAQARAERAEALLAAQPHLQPRAHAPRRKAQAPAVARLRVDAVDSDVSSGDGDGDVEEDEANAAYEHNTAVKR